MLLLVVTPVMLTNTYPAFGAYISIYCYYQFVLPLRLILTETFQTNSYLKCLCTTYLDEKASQDLASELIVWGLTIKRWSQFYQPIGYATRDTNTRL